MMMPSWSRCTAPCFPLGTKSGEGRINHIALITLTFAVQGHTHVPPALGRGPMGASATSLITTQLSALRWVAGMIDHVCSHSTTRYHVATLPSIATAAVEQGAHQGCLATLTTSIEAWHEALVSPCCFAVPRGRHSGWQPHHMQ